MSNGNAAVLMPDNEEELQSKTLAVKAVVDSVIITDKTSFEFAGSLLKEVADQGKKIKAWFKPMVEKAFAAHKEIKARENETLRPVEEMEKALRGKIQVYLTAEELKRQEAERKARIAAEEEAARIKAKLEADALKALDKGKEEKAEALLEKADQVFAAPVSVASTVDKTTRIEGGGTVSQKKDIEVVLPSTPDEIKALCSAVANGIVPITSVSFSKSVLKTWAKNNLITGRHHGCTFREISSVVVR